MSLLDTSYLIKLINENRFETGSISIITVIEFLRGLKKEKRERVKEALEGAFNIIQLDNEIILTYCELYEELRKSGELISDADLIIAATAKAKKMKLKTLDKDFKRLKNYGVNVEILKL